MEKYILAKIIDASEVGVEAIESDSVWSGALNAFYFIGGLAAITIIVIAGFLYVSSSGDAQKVQKAKNAILFSVVGLIVILSAFIITQFVIGRATA